MSKLPYNNAIKSGAVGLSRFLLKQKTGKNSTNLCAVYYGVEAVEFLQRRTFPCFSDYFLIVCFLTLNPSVSCDLIDIIPLEIISHGQLQA
jgi:hypothetical protein